MLCAAVTDAAIVINIVNRVGSLNVCRVVIVMSIIRAGSGSGDVCRAVLVYVGLACVQFLYEMCLAMYYLLVILCSC